MIKFWIFEFVILCLILIPLLMMSGLYSDRLRQRQALRGVMRRLDLALTASDIGVWEYNISQNELFWDDRIRKFYGVGLSRAISVDDWERNIHPEDVKRAKRDFELSVETDKPYRSSFRLVKFDGIVHIRTIGSKFIDDKGDTKIVGVNWDVTEEETRNLDLQKASQLAQKRNEELLKANEKIEQIALHDSLTQLPNRRYLDDFLTQVSQDSKKRFGFIHLDLDRFKDVNDTMGHAAGDALLVAVAERLRQAKEPQDFVARVGGDEFVMVCLSAQNQLELNTRAKKIVKTMQAPVEIGENKVLSTVSLGIALSSSAHGDPQQLMVNADIALYRAKKAGRNCFKYYSAQMHGQIVDNKKLSDDLFRALERNEFEAYVQPQFCASTHKISGGEILARWNHPSRGVLTPYHFMDAAQDLNILPQIDATMLDQGLEYMKHWRHLNLAPDHISVNVSARRLADPTLIDGLMKRPFRRGELTFELVESTFLDTHDDVVGHNLDRIRDLGIGIEIDDFGTGHASIVSLIKLHPNALKLDRQLTTTVGPNPASHQLVRSIVDIAKNLKIDVIAEGVETLEQAEILTLLGANTFQGFAFARPMPASEFEQFAIEWNARLVAA